MLKHRLIAGSIAGAAVAAALLIPGTLGAMLFSVLIVGLTILALSEYNRLAIDCRISLSPAVVMTMGVLLVVNVCLIGMWHPAGMNALFIWLPTELLLLCVFLLLSFIVAVQGLYLGNAVRIMVGTWSAIVLVYGTLGFIPKLYFAAAPDMSGRYLVLFLLVVTKCADIGAYAMGTVTARRPGGNHKLSPRLSPKKSWEGLAGGIGAAILAAIVLITLAGGGIQFRSIPVVTYGSGVILAIVFALLGMAGDLLESLLKRAASAKDSGRIPGLGGALDMVDSLVFAAPAFYAYVLFGALGF